jgi:LytS/YehU family sensor histidine kinase
VPRIGHTQAPADGRRGWLHAASFSSAAIVASYVAAIIVHFTVMPEFLGSPRAIAISGMWTLLFVGLFAGINSARALYRVAVARARAVEGLRAELAEAELRALRAQIQPHFLFNTLNSIAALVRSDPAAAEETITRLADVFRYALRASERSHARLADELEFLRDYLAIEHVRFGDRLRVVERVDPGLDDVPVPTLLLQPLVENAVKHGVSTRPAGGRVSLEVRDADDRVVVEIADDGAGMNGDAPLGEGFGLHSVRERVRAAGPPHALEIESDRTQGTRVRITLPKRPAASPRDAPSKGDTP